MNNKTTTFGSFFTAILLVASLVLGLLYYQTKTNFDAYKDTTTATINDYEQNSVSDEALILSLQNQISDKNDLIAQKQSQIELLQADAETNAELIEALEAEISELEASIAELEANVSAIQEDTYLFEVQGDTITGLSDYGKRQYLSGNLTTLNIPSSYSIERSVIEELFITKLNFNFDLPLPFYVYYEGEEMEMNSFEDLVWLQDLLEFSDLPFIAGYFIKNFFCAGNDYIITRLGQSCFERLQVSSVTIENGIEEISCDAFRDCTNLTSVEIPNSVTSIHYSSFACCSGLTSIIVDSNNTIYDSRDNCNAIIETSFNCLMFGCKHTVIPDSVTSIGEFAFDGCSGLTSITIPDSVTCIKGCAFTECTGLTSITISDSVESIGEFAFSGCHALTSITIPNSVTSIDATSFACCSGLTSIIVDSNNTIYDSRDNCNAIIETDTNILIVGCKNTVIPDSVERIGEFAFDGCSGLTSITIPANVRNIDASSFRACSGLTSITVDSNNTIYDSRDNCNAIIETGSNALIVACQNTIIPNDVRCVGYSAFSSCTGLTSIVIPIGVLEVCPFAFQACTALTDVYYTGSQAEWESISIGTSNEPLTNATIHYDYIIPANNS